MAVLAAFVLAVAPASSATAAVSPAAAPGSRATTKSYTFTLMIGMPEQMWTLAQFKSMHPKTGELMLMGSMMGGMPMGDSQRHLAVHIYARATGKPVAGADPTISVIDTTLKNPSPVKVPVAEMEGVSAGAADLHYGNNVYLTGGHTYEVVVTLNGQRAVLRAPAPA
jgi:hypothetical protein